MLDDILEFVLDLVVDLVFDAAKNKKLPKWILFPLLALIMVGSLTGILIIGISALKKSVILGTIMIAVFGVLVIALVILFVRRYRKEKKEKEIESLEREWQ